MWYKNLQAEFEQTIYDYQIEIDDLQKLAETCIPYCKKVLAELRTKFKEEIELPIAEEINFFKHIKPQFTARLIYFIQVYKIETHKPHGSVKVKRKYFQMELHKLKNYFDENLDFYRYYRTSSTYLDTKYFVRGKQDIRLSLDIHVFELDPEFCTSHDFKVATILANDLLQVHLENELTKLDFQTNTKVKTIGVEQTLNWTGSKVALVELLYALQISGVFNNGNADIKTIAAYFEKVFDIELGDYYRTYLELKLRHNPTKFIDSLRENFTRKIEEDDLK